jgi:hypothetical protein
MLSGVIPTVYSIVRPHLGADARAAARAAAATVTTTATAATTTATTLISNHDSKDGTKG